MDDIEFDTFKAELLNPLINTSYPQNARAEVLASHKLGRNAMQENVVENHFRSRRMFPFWFGRYKAFMLSRSRGYQFSSSKALPNGKQ